MEAEFFSGSDFYISPLTVANPSNPAETLVIHQARKRDGDESFFFKDTGPKKKRICLHYSGGFLPGDMNLLSERDNPASVPFVIARSGQIVSLFPSAFWSYHLGDTAIGGNKAMSSSSIAIELSNVGSLIKIGNKLQDGFGHDYCTLNDREAYVKRSFRGFDYFATFTNAQYDSLVKLLRLMTVKWDIPKVFLPTAKRFELMTSAEATAFRGVLTHANLRSDKYDIGPAFDWNRIVLSI